MSILAVTCENPADLKTYREKGADEVIFALADSCFSALRPFSEEEILTMAETARAENLRVSVLMNRLFHEDDIEAACEKMIRLCHGGIDAVLFADTGLMYSARKNGLEDRMIYQPETMMTSPADALTWCSENLQAVMISTLLTEQEILKIAAGAAVTGMNIHGYQLMSVSARPLLSAFALSAGKEPLKNKENLTLVEAKRQEHMPVFENEYATMIFSDYVLESFDEIRKFRDAGMKRFVIDGWHLDPQSVQEAVGLYRALLDGTAEAAEIREYRNTYKDIPFSKGYYDQKTVR